MNCVFLQEFRRHCLSGFSASSKNEHWKLKCLFEIERLEKPYRARKQFPLLEIKSTMTWWVWNEANATWWPSSLTMFATFLTFWLALVILCRGGVDWWRGVSCCPVLGGTWLADGWESSAWLSESYPLLITNSCRNILFYDEFWPKTRHFFDNFLPISGKPTYV